MRRGPRRCNAHACTPLTDLRSHRTSEYTIGPDFIGVMMPLTTPWTSCIEGGLTRVFFVSFVGRSASGSSKIRLWRVGDAPMAD